jgi:DNA-binding transcriptional regulator YiaG
MPETVDLLELAAVRRLCRDGAAQALRTTNGLSLAEVADTLGVCKASVSRWERGLQAPSGDHARAYGHLLRALVSMEDS